MIKLPDTVGGEKVSLIRIIPTQQNAEIMFDLVKRNRDFLGTYFRYLTLMMTSSKSALNHWHNNPQTTRYFIYHQNKAIGEIYACQKTDDNIAVVGYWLEKSHTRQGLMTEALQLMEKALFCSGCEASRLNIVPVNTPSLRLALKSGYREITVFSDPLSVRSFEKTKKMYEAAEKHSNVRRICSHTPSVEGALNDARLNSMVFTNGG